VPDLVGAMFEAQSLKEELEWRGSQNGEALSRMIESLVGAVCGIDSIADPKQIPGEDEQLSFDPVNGLQITPNTSGRTAQSVRTRSSTWTACGNRFVASDRPGAREGVREATARPMALVIWRKFRPTLRGSELNYGRF
jgi:hypothetical protein